MDESWTIKKAEHWRIDAFEFVVLEKTLESPLDCKEIQPVHPKGNQSWIFIERTDAEAETPILWLSDSSEKTLMLGKMKAGGEGDDRGWDGWVASPTQWTWVWASFRVGDGQGGLACCSWGRKELDTTETLHWTEAWPCFNKFLPLYPRVQTVNSLPLSCPSTHDTTCLSGLSVLTLLNTMFCLQFIPIILQLCLLNCEAFNKNYVFYSHVSFSDGRPHKQTFYKVC